MLLVYGMGGSGKTTLLHHLAAWWQSTGLVDRVFAFSYEDRAWSAEQIVDAIARNLMSKADLAAFQPLGPDQKRTMLADKLRARRHLVLLDNMESITGSHLAIRHTLTPKARGRLQRLLADLGGGQTIVLLGSRGGEEWLAKGTL